MSKIDIVGTAENSIALAAAVAVAVVIYYVVKAGKASAETISDGVSKVENILSNPFTSVFKFGAQSPPNSKPLGDLGNVNENGVLQYTPDKPLLQKVVDPAGLLFAPPTPVDLGGGFGGMGGDQSAQQYATGDSADNVAGNAATLGADANSAPPGSFVIDESGFVWGGT